MDRDRTDPREVYRGLRDRALQCTLEDLGIEVDGPETPFGILMETGYSEAVVTLVCFLSGDASVYFSRGGGIIGAGQHDAVAEAAHEFVLGSAPFLGTMRATETFPLPAIGKTVFYVKTETGLFTAEEDEDVLGDQESPLSPLFYAGQDVITQVRLHDSREQQ